MLLPTVTPAAPALPQWWYGFDPAGSDDGVVLVRCGPLPPNEQVAFTYPAQRAATVNTLRIVTSINGMPHVRVHKFTGINVANGDSIEFKYTLRLEYESQD